MKSKNVQSKKKIKVLDDELEDYQEIYMVTTFDKISESITKIVPKEFKPKIPPVLDITSEELPKTLFFEIPYLNTIDRIYSTDQIQILIEWNIGKNGKISKVKPVKLTCT